MRGVKNTGEISKKLIFILQLPINISIAAPETGSVARRWGKVEKISQENEFKTKNKAVFDGWC